MPGLLRASALYCGVTTPSTIILGFRSPQYWAFWDYSWRCPVCALTHCSDCVYYIDEDLDAVVVLDCGRFGKTHDYWDLVISRKS